jgi:hypothetical protein
MLGICGSIGKILNLSFGSRISIEPKLGVALFTSLCSSIKFCSFGLIPLISMAFTTESLILDKSYLDLQNSLGLPKLEE